MDAEIKVGDIMTRNFIWVSPETDLKKCAKTMIKKRVGSLIVKEEDDLKGILTEKDILWAIVKKSKKELSSILAKDVMKRKVYTIKPSSDIVEALRRIKKKRIRRLPVIENKKVIGMLTTNDILRIDPSLFKILFETIEIKGQREKMKKSEKWKTKRKQGTCEECGQFDFLYLDNGLFICERCYNSK